MIGNIGISVVADLGLGIYLGLGVGGNIRLRLRIWGVLGGYESS